MLQTPSDETKKEEISKLDLLRHHYIGKHIQFFPRNSNATSMQWFHYGNFYAHDPIELMSPYAVTLETSRDRRYSLYQKGWRNIRKVLDEIRYNSKAVNTYTKVFDDGFRDGDTYTFHKGHFTPYDAIEGHSFLVKGIQESECLNRNVLYGLKRNLGASLPFNWNIPIYVFELEDERGEPVYWMRDKNNSNISGFVVEEIDTIKNLYIGNYYYIRPPDSGNAGKSIKELSTNKHVDYHERLLAKDIVLTEYDASRNFYTPHLLLEDNHGTLYKIELTNNLDLRTTSSVSPAQASISYLMPENTILAERAAEEERKRELTLRREQEAERARLERIRLDDEFRIEQQQIRNSYVSKYGTRNANLIMDGQVALGMTKQMCIAAWGEPESVNRNITSRGTSEQWVYGIGIYLYFEGNKLTGIQD